MRPSCSKIHYPISPIGPDYAAVNHAIRVQSSNTKSRVETQIKLTIQLLGNQWSWLRVSESLLYKKKVIRQHKDGVLNLEAYVVSDSNPSKKVSMCQGCARRERKRAQRRIKPVVDDDQKILLFNCEPLIDFSKGEAVLSTRITCYCRHHNERIGFRIQFIMRNAEGVVIATGISLPIMVTDDHKNYFSPPINKYSTFDTTSRASCKTEASLTGFNHASQGEIYSNRNPATIPMLDTVIPCRGSSLGGHRVTIAGKGFHGNLIPTFNHREAIVLGWSPTAIHCISPPAEQTGPVVISLKGYTITTKNPLFYYDETDSKHILNLAVQITGIQPQNTNNIEFGVIQILSQSRHCYLLGTNAGGQNLLHLASYYNYIHLIQFLVARNLNLVHSQDHNGLSALHFSCLAKSTEAMCILLKCGSYIALRSSIGTSMDIVSKLLAYDITIDKTDSAWIPNLFINMATHYYQCNMGFINEY